MLARRAVLFAVSTGIALSGCRFFRPINPNATEPKDEPAAQPAPTAAAPARTQETAPAKTQESRPAERPAGRQHVVDANIAAMVLALNNTDISYARLAPARAERDDVKKFADRMLTDHTGVNQLLTTLLDKLDLAPEDNVSSLDMRDESAEKRDLMRELSGYAFDSTYIENEVTYHRKFLTQLDNVMLPTARNADLKALLTSVRPAVASHLAHAEQVRADVIAKR